MQKPILGKVVAQEVYKPISRTKNYHRGGQNARYGLDMGSLASTSETASPATPIHRKFICPSTM